MSRRTFRGGVHPPPRKDPTEHVPIVDMPPPERVVVPFSQHIGAPSKPVVKRGDEVVAGQVIGEPQGFVSVPVHTPISGKIVAVQPMPHPLGAWVESAVIEGDSEERWVEGVGEQRDWTQLDVDTIKSLIEGAGIVGMGGATFPTHVKLSPPTDQPIDMVILNGAECEPYITADHRLMLERAEEIFEGLKIILKVLNSSRGYIAIEENKPDAIETMAALAQAEPTIEVVPLHVKYPQGAEKQLIYALTRRTVPAGGLPMAVGCLVQNVATAAAVYRAVVWSTPLVERVLTVTGGGIVEPKNLRVRIGTPFRDVIAFCGGYADDASKLVMGGPMMGLAQATDEVPVIKGTSCILILGKQEAPMEVQPRACISCGRCVEVCPMNLIPTMIARLVEHQRWEEAEAYGILNCFECGSCSYGCPSKIHLTQLFKYGKSVIMAQKKAKAA